MRAWLAVILLASIVGCGRYGPPLRTTAGPGPAPAGASDPNSEAEGRS